MDIAKLNKRIQIIQTVQGDVDSAGFETGETEQVIRECWAQVLYTGGKELIGAGQELSQAKICFRIRAAPIEITTDMRVRYAGKTYDIQYVDTHGDTGKLTEIWTEWRGSP